MTLQTTPWNIQDYLISEERIAGFLDAVFEEGDPATIARALDDAVRARKRIADSQNLPNVSESIPVSSLESLAEVLNLFHLKLAVVPQ
ncbi:MAG: hypothetical protein LBH00_10285 [Planctomycetaceae bacterium]|jgi:DNA-binding phage protein|nr:hypothetical protein [Planctomycetaceae bacterium]